MFAAPSHSGCAHLAMRLSPNPNPLPLCQKGASAARKYGATALRLASRRPLASRTDPSHPKMREVCRCAGVRTPSSRMTHCDRRRETKKKPGGHRIRPTDPGRGRASWRSAACLRYTLRAFWDDREALCWNQPRASHAGPRDCARQSAVQPARPRTTAAFSPAPSAHPSPAPQARRPEPPRTGRAGARAPRACLPRFPPPSRPQARPARN